MLTLNGIRAVPSQTFNTNIDQGLIRFKLEFKPAIKMWFIDIEFIDFFVNSIRVCNSPNLLEQYTNLIPFGLSVSISQIGYEPSSIDDFTSERVTLNVLDQNEVEQIEQVYKDLA